jgi:hypothetical protein
MRACTRFPASSKKPTDPDQSNWVLDDADYQQEVGQVFTNVFASPGRKTAALAR